MSKLHAGQFGEFFEAMHGRPPFPWQDRLAQQACVGEWPDVIHLPTASGKTACIDIALFALAVRGRQAARRIFFVVDRRVVVNEAYLRSIKVRDALKCAKGGVLRVTADSLRKLACDQNEEFDEEEDPLFVSEMRGGIFRDESWVRNPLQPTVIASTVDQVGSRLLFRGYGLKSNSWPLHAGLIGNDALIFLDEAHCSRAFAQTLGRVEKYRGPEWCTEPLGKPFHFVEMTATPSRNTASERFFTLDADDRRVEALQQRLQAEKPTRLIEVAGRKDDSEKIADELVRQAIDLADSTQAKRVAIFANRVLTAKTVFQSLHQQLNDTGISIQLAIGRMRAVDRQEVFERDWIKLKSDRPRDAEDVLTFVVSTQCLEVGADLDFDVLVSECASIDALQQRFGRLDRLGNFKLARGAIVIGSWQVNAKKPDPVYGDAIAKSWNWLTVVGGENRLVNMGIESKPGHDRTISEQLTSLNEQEKNSLLLIGEDAPVLLPAHVDMFAQTSPTPQPEPLVELFLHGPVRAVPDVNVVWRSDLDEAESLEEDIQIVKLCPPSSLEAMPVPIGVFRRWFAGENSIDEQESDLELGNADVQVAQHRKTRIYTLAWDTDESVRIWNANEIKPGQTLILKESTGGWDQLGYIPKGMPIDVGDQAAFLARTAISLRFHPRIMQGWPETPSRELLVKDMSSTDATWDKDTKNLLSDYATELTACEKRWPFLFLTRIAEMQRPVLDSYPRQQSLRTLRARLPRKPLRREIKQVFLDEHLRAVEQAVGVMASGLAESFRVALGIGARFHDYGKADARFQAWLLAGDLTAARYLPRPIAKSGNDVLQKQSAVGLPEGFRHELLSLMLAEKSPEIEGEMRDLILHLIATHHGRCRPFAPVITDAAPECVRYGSIEICTEERRQAAPHSLAKGLTDRFWLLVSRHGWWGLAYLEATLRLADWQASDDVVAEVSD